MFTRTMGRPRHKRPTSTVPAGAPHEAASACSEFLAPPDQPRRALRIPAVHRRALAWSLITGCALLLVLWSTKP